MPPFYPLLQLILVAGLIEDDDRRSRFVSTSITTCGGILVQGFSLRCLFLFSRVHLPRVYPSQPDDLGFPGMSAVIVSRLHKALFPLASARLSFHPFVRDLAEGPPSCASERLRQEHSPFLIWP